ncbi:DUF1189 family protein [Shouchella lonarensis]|uniref:Maltodextrin utilization protein YvdJ n=1 Tax=Shouchella lonarensis TaxID=1464122 RepID=A0A1G6KNY2_9BACI|nr:DUF1189 family protein [Shouchella lonarensis]SDC32548.1 Protein of unknown function [Shouchella lonarensis]
MNFWKWITKSLYHLPMLSASRMRPITQTIFHVLFVLLIACMPFFVSLGVTLHKQIDQVVTFLDSTNVDVTIENQQLTIEKEQTYFFDDHAFLLTNDEGHIASFISKHQQGVVFGPTSLLVFSNDSEQTIPYAFAGSSVSSDRLLDTVTSMQSFLPIIVVIFSLMIYMLYATGVFILISLVASITLLFKKEAHAHITYRHLWGITAHATSGPLLLFLTTDLLVRTYSDLPLLSTLLSATLIAATLTLSIFALKKIPPKKRKPTLT